MNVYDIVRERHKTRPEYIRRERLREINEYLSQFKEKEKEPIDPHILYRKFDILLSRNYFDTNK